jgi:hypothetical protein
MKRVNCRTNGFPELQGKECVRARSFMREGGSLGGEGFVNTVAGLVTNEIQPVARGCREG